MEERTQGGQADWRIEEGLHVYGSDGQEIGTVADVWPESEGQVLPETSGAGDAGGVTAYGAGWATPSYRGGGLPPTVGGRGDTPVEAQSDVPGGSRPVRTAGGGYFKIDRGGFLGIGGSDLYVPYGAIDRVDSDGIRLNVAADQVGNQGWESKPPSLS